MIDRNRVWDRVGALTGAAFVGLTVLGLGIAGEVDVENHDSAADIARAFEDRAGHADVGILFSLAGFAFFVPIAMPERHGGDR